MASKRRAMPLIQSIMQTLFHGRTRTAYLYRYVWSGITGALRRDQTNRV